MTLVGRDDRKGFRRMEEGTEEKKSERASERMNEEHHSPGGRATWVEDGVTHSAESSAVATSWRRREKECALRTTTAATVKVGSGRAGGQRETGLYRPAASRLSSSNQPNNMRGNHLF